MCVRMGVCVCVCVCMKEMIIEDISFALYLTSDRSQKQIRSESKINRFRFQPFTHKVNG